MQGIYLPNLARTVILRGRRERLIGNARLIRRRARGYSISLCIRGGYRRPRAIVYLRFCSPYCPLASCVLLYLGGMGDGLLRSTISGRRGYQSYANVTMMARRSRWQPWPWLSRRGFYGSCGERVPNNHESHKNQVRDDAYIYMHTVSSRLPKSKVFSSENAPSYEYFQCPFAFASDALRITTTSKLFSNAYLRMNH